MTDRLYAAAQRALSALDDLMRYHDDPGAECFGARYELAQALIPAAGILGAARQAAKVCCCEHPADEHSVYGCADDCACEWMPRRTRAARQPAGQTTRHRIPCGPCGAPWSDGHGQPGDPCPAAGQATATEPPQPSKDAVDRLRLAATQWRHAYREGDLSVAWDEAAVTVLALIENPTVTWTDLGFTRPAITGHAVIQPVVEQPAEAQPADLLAECATEYHVPVPEGGGTVLLARRQALVHGTGWSVSTRAYGGGRAWTTEGWQESISALSVDRLFCWPDAATAVDEARRALANVEADEETR